MSQINELTTTTALAGADMLPIWSVQDQDTRKTTVDEVTEFVGDALGVELITASITYNVPSNYLTVQDAINAAKNIRVAPGIQVIVNIETGDQIGAPISQAYADLRHIRITSADATVSVAAGFNADTNVAQFINCDAPIWDILLDCQARGRNGVWLENSTMEVKPARGVQNAGAAGTLDPRGCGFFAWKGASLQVTPSTGPLTGMIARGCAWRGVDITHNSQASIVASDLTDNGTLIPIADGHAGLFVSRSSSVQADNSIFDGSINGIRNARSMVTARTASFQNIPGVLVRQFEGGFVNVSGSNMANSGTATYPLLLIEGAAADRPQGGGQIIAESCDWTGAVYDLATVRGASGLIVLDDATGTGLLGRIGVAVNGKINADRATLAAAVGNTSNEALLASFGGNISAIGLTWTGAAGMSYTARAIEDGYISVAGANLTTATVAHLAVADAGEIYSDGATFSAGVFPAVMKGPKAGQAMRPEDFGAVGDGTPVDATALNAWAAWPGALEMTPGKTYAIAAQLAIPDGATIRTNGSAISVQYNVLGTSAAITMGIATILDDFTASVATGFRVNRLLSNNGGSIIGKTTLTSVDQQPNNNFRWDDLWATPGALTVGNTYTGMGAIAVAAYTRNAVFSFDASVVVPASPTGIIFELGNGTTGAFLGFSGGNLIFRAGDGTAGTPANAAVLSVADTVVAGKTGIFYGRITPGAQGTVELWFFQTSNNTLYFIGAATASGTFADWSANTDGGFGTFTGTAIAGGYVGANFNGTSTRMRAYHAQSYADFRMRTASSIKCDTPDNLHGALRSRSSGLTPISYGDIEITNFDFAHTVTIADEVTMGNSLITSYVRGMKAENLDRLTFGTHTARTRSPNAVEGHIPGQNGLLLSDVYYVDGGFVDVANSGEHGVRFGGEAAERVLELLRFSATRTRQTGQSGVKIKGSALTAKIVDLGTLTVEDAGYRVGDLAASPGVNEAGVLVEGIQELRIAGGSIKASAGKTYSCNTGLDIRGVRRAHVDDLVIENALSGVTATSIVDATNRPLEEMTGRIFARTIAGRLFDFTYQTANIGNVDLRGFVNGCTGAEMLRVRINSAAMATDGPVYFDVKHAGVTGTVTSFADSSGPALGKYMANLTNLDTRVSSVVTP